MRYGDIKAGMVVFKKQHRVRIICPTVNLDEGDNITYGFEIEYLNQNRIEFAYASDLSDHPLHCFECGTTLIDDTDIKTCSSCDRVICPNCSRCHCGTPWTKQRVV
jgi:hypothetical protein